MNGTKNLSVNKDGPLVKLLKNLRAAVEKLVNEEDLEKIELPPVPGPVTARGMKSQAEAIIQQLKYLANLGSADAVRALRDLGNSAAESLVSLLPGEPKEMQETGLPPLYGMPLAADLKPANLQVDLASVNEILTRGRHTILGSSSEEIHTFYGIIKYQREIRVEVRVNPSIERLQPPPMATDAQIVTTAGNTEYSASRFRAMGAITAIETVVSLMIQTRISALLAKRRREALNLVASQSLVWPIPAPAFEDRREEIVDLLNALPLGKMLPFRLTRKEGSGANRDLNGGPTALALEYCTQMFIIQDFFHPLSTNYKAKLKRIDQNLDSDRRKSNRNTEYAFKIEDWEFCWNLENHWEVKSALLPIYPPTRQGQPPGLLEEKQLKKWLDASVLLAQSRCSGDGGNPNWQLAASGVSSEGDFKKKMMAGMKNLQLVS